jgi:hypothetical protein
LNVKVVLAVLILAVAATIYVASLPKSDALAGPSVCTYYSDAKYKTVVGARGTGCCGSVISWGVVTAYKKCEILYCTDQICPN